MIASNNYRCTIHIACVIHLPCTFTYYLDLSNFILESGLSYFRVLTICLLLIYFVSVAGCHCFDLYELDGILCMVDHSRGHLKSCNFFHWLHCIPKLKDTAFSFCSLHPGQTGNETGA